MLTDAQLTSALEASPAPRVTEEYIDSRIISEDYLRIPGTNTTHCTITLDNAFTVTGEAACVNPENYNEAIGQTYARRTAFAKLWPLFGFLVAENNFKGKE